MKFIVDVAVVLALILIGFFLYVEYGSDLTARFTGSDTKATIYIDRVAFSVQTATTEKERERGLSGQSSLPQFGGMLFVFPTAAKHGFWMKDMQFPIDILWFDASFTLVHVERNVQPSSYPTVYAPRADARFVVELNANMAERTDLVIGDTLNMPPELIPADLRDR